MAEVAQPVIERAEAPSTPPEDVSEPKKVTKLSYDPGALPKPINNHDEYVRASLIEARATRAAMERISAALNEIVELLRGQQAPVASTPAKAPEAPATPKK